MTDRVAVSTHLPRMWTQRHGGCASCGTHTLNGGKDEDGMARWAQPSLTPCQGEHSGGSVLFQDMRQLISGFRIDLSDDVIER